MAGFTNQTSEKAIQAIINAGKVDSLILQSGSLKNLDWNEKLKYLIKETPKNLGDNSTNCNILLETS